MDWAWKRESDTCYRLDETWTVQRDWVANRWYAHRGNAACLVDHPDAGAAMEEAERLRKADAAKPPAEPVEAAGPTIEHARREQVAAAERYMRDQHPGAELGMGDWFAEEFLMEEENRNDTLHRLR